MNCAFCTVNVPDTLPRGSSGSNPQQLDQYVNGVRVARRKPRAGSWPVIRRSRSSAVAERWRCRRHAGCLWEDARTAIADAGGVELGLSKLPELVLEPEDGGARASMDRACGHQRQRRTLRLYVDAKTGGSAETAERHRETQLPTDAYVGHGKGVFGDDRN